MLIRRDKLTPLSLLFFTEFLRIAKKKGLDVYDVELKDDYILKDKHSGWLTISILVMLEPFLEITPREKFSIYNREGNWVRREPDVVKFDLDYYISINTVKTISQFKEFIEKDEKSLDEELEDHYRYIWFVVNLYYLLFAEKMLRRVYTFVPLVPFLKGITSLLKSDTFFLKLQDIIPTALPFEVVLKVERGTVKLQLNLETSSYAISRKFVNTRFRKFLIRIWLSDLNTRLLPTNAFSLFMLRDVGVYNRCVLKLNKFISQFLGKFYEYEFGYEQR